MEPNPFRQIETNPFKTISTGSPEALLRPDEVNDTSLAEEDAKLTSVNKEENPFRKYDSNPFRSYKEPMAKFGNTDQAGIPTVPQATDKFDQGLYQAPTFIGNLKKAVEGLSDTTVSGVTSIVGASTGLVNGIVSSIKGINDPKSQSTFMGGFEEGYNMSHYEPATEGGQYWQSKIDSAFNWLADRAKLESDMFYDKTRSPEIGALVRTIDEGTPQVLGLLLGSRAAKLSGESIGDSIAGISKEVRSKIQQKEILTKYEPTEDISRSGAQIISEEKYPLEELKLKAQQAGIDISNIQDKTHIHPQDMIENLKKATNPIELPEKIGIKENILAPSEERIAGETINSTFDQYSKRGDFNKNLTKRYAKQMADILEKNPDIDAEKLYHAIEAEGKEYATAVEYRNKTKQELIKEKVEGATKQKIDTEHPSLVLTPKEQSFFDMYLKPMTEYMDWGKGYVHREAMTRTPMLDRIKATSSDFINAYKERGISGVAKEISEKYFTERSFSRGSLRTTSTSNKSRVMYALVDDRGYAKVAAFKGKRVFDFEDGPTSPKDIGRKKTGVMGKQMEKEAAPVQRRLDDINAQIKQMEKIVSRMDKSNDSININSRIIDLQEKADTLEEQLNNIYGNYDPATMKDKVFKDKEGKSWTVKDATTAMIEQETNVRYYKNIVTSVLDAWTDKVGTTLAKEFLEQVKNSPEFRQFATKASSSNIPDYYKTTQLRQFMGYRMHPELANIFDQVAKEIGQVADWKVPVWHEFNHFVKDVFFLFPQYHELNLLSYAIKNRGLNWMDPRSYSTFHETLQKAIKMVDTMDPEYTRLYTEKNVPFQYIRSPQVKSWLTEDPTGIHASYSRLLGQDYNKPNIFKRRLDYSNSRLWRFDDIMKLRDYLERTSLGMPEDEALSISHKHFPTYELYRGNKTANFLAHPDITFFFRYRSFVVKEFATTARELVSGQSTLEQRKRAAGMFATLGVMSYMVTPMAQDKLREWSGNSNIYLAHFGPEAMANVLNKMKDERSPMPLIKHFLNFAPGAVETVGQLMGRGGVDYRSGAPITKEADRGTLKEVTDRSIHALSQVPSLMELYQDPTAWHFFLAQIGVHVYPTPKSELERKQEAMFNKINKSPEDILNTKFKDMEKRMK